MKVKEMCDGRMLVLEQIEVVRQVGEGVGCFGRAGHWDGFWPQ